MSDRYSLADRSVDTLSAIRAIDADVTNDTPNAYTFRRLRMAAEKAFLDGRTTAAEIVEAATALRHEQKK